VSEKFFVRLLAIAAVALVALAQTSLAAETPCSADYFAVQTDPSKVAVVIAHGTHPTGGYKTWLERDRQNPPTFTLKCKAPDGMATQVLTPFTVAAAINPGTAVKNAITVKDASGTKQVVVVKASEGP
jgi:hypothetical protein